MAMILLGRRLRTSTLFTGGGGRGRTGSFVLTSFGGIALDVEGIGRVGRV